MEKYIRNNSTITGRLQDELVMMDIQKGKYFSLNPVATRIWELLEQSFSAEQLCSELGNEYEVDPGRCLSEVLEHLSEMEKLGLVTKE